MRGARRLSGALVLLGIAGAFAFFLRDREAETPPGSGGPSARQRTATLEAGPPVPVAAAAPPASSGVRLSPLDPALRGVGGLRMRLVRGPSEEAVAGAQVVLHGTGHGGEPIRVVATSDAEGRVAMRHVPAGPWLTLQVVVGERTLLARADVDVVSGREVDLGDLEVDVPRTLRVTAWDEQARPIAGALVEAASLERAAAERLFRSVREHLLTAPVAWDRSARTDDRGVATLGGLVPGRYLVRARAQRRAEVSKFVRIPPEAGVTTPPWILRAGVRVRGRLVDEAGAPVAEGMVLAWSESDGAQEEGASLPRAAPADADGRFDITVPSAASYEGVWAAAPGRPAAWIPRVGSPEDLRIILRRGAMLEIRTVDAESGAPIPAAAVDVGVVVEGTRNDWSWDAWTDERGLLRVDVPLDGSPSVRVYAPGYREAVGPFAPDGEGFQEVALPASLSASDVVSLPIRMQRRATRTIEGVVVDPTGRPVGHAALDDSYGDGGVRGRTDASGRFRYEVALEDGRLPKDLWLTVAEAGLAVRNPWVHFQDSAEAPFRGSLRLEVLPTTSIRGRVVDAAGRPVEGARVAWSGHHGPDRPVLTDAAGRFLLEDVEATDRHGQSSITSVVARAHGFDVAQGERFAAPPGRTVDVGAIVLERGSEVEGIVLDPEGRPAAGSRVCAWEPPAIHRGVIRAAFAVTGPDGRFRVSGLPPPHDRWERTLVVRAEPRGDDEAATSVSVTTSVAAPVASVDLRLPRGILVRGTVVDADGASVFLRSGSWFSWTTSARNGAFEFRNVPFGKATLRVRSGDLGADHDVDVPLSAPLRLVLHGDPEDSTELDDIWWGRDDTPAPPEDSAW